MSFLYKYKTSTLTPFVKPHDILNLAVQNLFYTQLHEESAHKYDLGLTIVDSFPVLFVVETSFLFVCFSISGRNSSAIVLQPALPEVPQLWRNWRRHRSRDHARIRR